MSPLDEIAQKRSDAQRAKELLGIHEDTLSSASDNAGAIVQATKSLATTDDINQLLEQFQQFGMHLIAGFQALADTMNNQPDIPALLEKMHSSISNAISALGSTQSDEEQLETLKSIEISLNDLLKVESIDPNDYKKSQESLLQAVKAIKLNPTINVPESVVNVPEPVVTINEKKIDFKPLQQTIKDYMQKPDVEKEDSIDLECYKAQDISESGRLQYIGFLNPEGGWYIIENDTKSNKLRYIFGDRDYEKAFDKAATYDYLLLNEAINAV